MARDYVYLREVMIFQLDKKVVTSYTKNNIKKKRRKKKTISSRMTKASLILDSYQNDAVLMLFNLVLVT